MFFLDRVVLSYPVLETGAKFLKGKLLCSYRTSRCQDCAVLRRDRGKESNSASVQRATRPDAAPNLPHAGVGRWRGQLGY